MTTFGRHTAIGCFLLVIATCSTGLASDGLASDGWQTRRIHEKFFSEGASAGDIDGDGRVDLVAGPLWYRGPEFNEVRQIATPREFPVTAYSDQFFSEVFDANGDGASDVLVLGFPGKAARLYLNPANDRPAADRVDGAWPMVEVADVIDNESPAIIDIVAGGLPEIVCGREGQYGFYSANENATEPWNWNPVTRPGACKGKFAHALGVGDVDGDGRLDLLDKTFWWRHPDPDDQSMFWQRQRWSPEDYGGGGAQIRVDDIDGDGDNDVVTSLNAHGYGLAWFEQTSEGRFVRHGIMGESSTDNEYGVSFSQLHAVQLVDIDGDGRKDIVTGKRWMAHRGKDPGGLQEPVLYWFQCVTNEKDPRIPSDGNSTATASVRFVPRLIDRDSGVGVDVLVADLNADERPDIVSSSKRGLSIHLQHGDVTATVPESWKQTRGTDQSKYADGFAPDQAAKNTLVADGFSVDLIASEPELTQPIAMCFDARGRIWVVEGHTYPTKADEGEGLDRVVILEDADGNGSFETKKTFIEGLNLASGIELGFGGVWVGAAPHLLFIPDADRDDVPDAEPKVLLDGWGYQDTHETLNSFTWGPDGWLYGCQGVFTHSKVGKPGAPDDQRVKMNAGVWRYHPTAHRFEVFSHGTSNPWGVDFDDRGEWFVSACVIPHLYHIQKGGRFQRQAGQHFNPHTYDDIKTIADHAHFAGNLRDHAFWGDNKVTKPFAPADTSLLGGGHAHCGLAIYNANVFPSEYQGDMLFHNLHGHRVVRERLEKDGSGFVGRHRPDFAYAQDHKEIGVGIMVGPDGAVYTSDWHDIQTCHNRVTEAWDRTNGRLFRIRYGDVNPQKFDLWAETDEQLCSRLTSGNAFFARQAQRILHERAVKGTIDIAAVSATLDPLLASDSGRDRLRALWTMWCIGAVDESQLVALMTNADEYVRGWAVHFLGEQMGSGEPLQSLQAVVDLAKSDPSPVVRRYLASLLQDLPHAQRWPVIEALASREIDQHDRNIPYLVWYGLEPLVAEEPNRAYDLAKECKWPNLLRFTLRRTTVTHEGREMLVAKLADPAERPFRLAILEELVAAATSRGGVAMPEYWPTAYADLVNAKLPRVRQLTRSLAVQFGDGAVLPYFRQLLTDSDRPKQQRLEALAALRTANDSELPRLISLVWGDREVSAEAVSALAKFDDPTMPGRLIAQFDQFDDATKTAALSTLVSRAEGTEKLIDAMESGSIQAGKVPAFIVRQALALGREDFSKRLEQVWGRIETSSEEKQLLYAKYRKMLRPRAIAGADASRGRQLYEANCGKCHKLFGVGGNIGPDITGANRTKVDYWLENILDPNALIGKAYQTTRFLTADGRVVSGVVLAENDDAVTVQTATEKVVIPGDEIEARSLSNVSLMPEGQLEPMKDLEVLSLFKYLMGPSQVPLPADTMTSAKVEPSVRRQ